MLRHTVDDHYHRLSRVALSVGCDDPSERPGGC